MSNVTVLITQPSQMSSYLIENNDHLHLDLLAKSISFLVFIVRNKIYSYFINCQKKKPTTFFFFLIFFFLNLLFIYYVYFWLCRVFVSVWGLSPVAASGGHSSSRCAGLSLSRPLLLRSTGSRRSGSAVVAHGPSRSAACGILPDQGSNPCPPHWQADSQPLRHQGSPPLLFWPNLNYIYKWTWCRIDIIILNVPGNIV